ncbi:MAG: hypothetical protein Q4F65_11270 [Propionibacteriaceae bacterium]|nr:hypothetical protein [Propionibacteriaceae bacterium]
MADTSLDKLVKLSSALPKEDAENGLDHLAQQAYDDPKGTMIVGVVVLDVHETKYRPTTDQEVAVVRIREIEAVPLDVASDLYERMKAMRIARRGVQQDELPEEDLDDHLDADVHPDTVAIVPADEDAVVTDIFDPKKQR